MSRQESRLLTEDDNNDYSDNADNDDSEKAPIFGPHPVTLHVGECKGEEADAELLKYVPRRDFFTLTLAPSNTAPSDEEYAILDRTVDEDGIPSYVIRRITATQSERPSHVRPDHVSSLRPINASCPQPHDSDRYSPSLFGASLAIPGYDPNDTSIIEVSLFEIDRYASAREIERFENSRFASPSPEDGPHRTPPASLSGSSAAGDAARARGRPRKVEGLSTWEKKAAGRPPKKQKMTDSAVRRMDPIILIAAKPTSCPPSEASENGSSVLAVHATDMDIRVNIAEREEEEEEEEEEELKEKYTLRKAKYSMISPPSPTARSTTAESGSDLSLKSETNSRRASQLLLAPLHPTAYKLPSRKRSSQSSTITSSSNASTDTRPNRMQKRRMTRTAQHPVPTSECSIPLDEHTSNSQPPAFSTSMPLVPLKAVPQKTPSPNTESYTHNARGLVRGELEIDNGEKEEEEEEYEISHIITHHDDEDERYYLAGWVGYPDPTWLTEDELQGAQQVLGEYLDNLARLENKLGVQAN